LSFLDKWDFFYLKNPFVSDIKEALFTAFDDIMKPNEISNIFTNNTLLSEDLIAFRKVIAKKDGPKSGQPFFKRH
jgi:hypothetical protein